MPVEDGISLFTFAFEKEDEDKLFARWIGFAQYEVSFEDFKRKLAPVKAVNTRKTLDRLDNLMESVVSWENIPIRSE